MEASHQMTDPENVSSSCFPNTCPVCDCEVSGFRKKFFGKKKGHEMKIVCGECKTKLIVRKVGKQYGIFFK